MAGGRGRASARVVGAAIVHFPERNDPIIRYDGDPRPNAVSERLEPLGQLRERAGVGLGVVDAAERSHCPERLHAGGDGVLDHGGEDVVLQRVGFLYRHDDPTHLQRGATEFRWA